MSEYPRATQSYKPLNKKDKITRTAICPTHSKQTSDHVGTSKRTGKLLWLFRCSYSDHIFPAIPDPSAPQSEDQVADWIKSQGSKRFKNLQ